MNLIWNSFKDRRYAALFFVIFLVSIGIFFGLLAFFQIPNFQEYVLQSLPGIGILIVALVWRSIRRARARRGEKFRRQEMSRDEIRKARSKLVNKIKT
jgi:hypothetical protein